MKKVFMVILIGLVVTGAVFAACSVEFISNNYRTKLLLSSYTKDSDEVVRELSKYINLDKGVLVSTDSVEYATERYNEFLNVELFNSVVQDMNTIYMFNNEDNIMIGTFRNAQFNKFLFEDSSYSSDSISIFDLVF